MDTSEIKQRLENAWFKYSLKGINLKNYMEENFMKISILTKLFWMLVVWIAIQYQMENKLML